MNNELYSKLKQLDIEDFIWLIYLFIIFYSWYSNSLERKYFLTKNSIFKSKYNNTIRLIFSILIIVYIYFLKSSISDLKSLKCTDSIHRKNLVYLSFFGSLFVTISGIVFLFIAFNDDNIDVELAFN